MNSSELKKNQEALWTVIDQRFSEVVKKYGSIVYCKKEYLNKPVYDGCLDVEKYATAPIHVMWILKEHNDMPKTLDNGHFSAFVDCFSDPEGFKKNVSKYRSLRLIERASRRLLKQPEGDPTMAFKSVAIVNLGKCPGENTTSDSRLDDLVKWWGDILTKQVSVYKPDMIIVPGSHFPRIAKLLACDQTTGRSSRKGKAKAELYTANGSLPIITIQHPSWYGCKEHDWMSALSKAASKAGCRM